MVDGDEPGGDGGASAAIASAPHLTRIPALDGLRGVAVIAVLFFHSNRLRGGYLGVDLFFVLSGFLITSLLLVEERDRGRVRLGRFYERRARRLLPAMGLALIGVAIYAAVWAQPSELPRIRLDGLSTLFYFANWRDILAKQTYWDLTRAPSPLQHTWSLAIEEQFYLVWPLIVIGAFAVRRSARSVLAVAVGLGTACAVLTFIGASRHGDQRLFYYGTGSRAPALFMGAGLAAIVALRGTIKTRRGRIGLEVAALASVAVLAVEWASQPGEGLSLYRGPLLLCGLAATIVVASAAHPEPGPIARVLAIPPLVGAGLISYGLYLYHWPIFLILTHARTGLSPWPLFALRVGVSVAVALLSYFLIEMPIRSGAMRPPLAFAMLAASTAVIVGAILVTTHVSVITIPTPAASSGGGGGWPRATQAVVPGTEVRSFLPPGDWSRLTNPCEPNVSLPAVKKVGRTRQPKVLLIGDSVGCFVGASFDGHQVTNGIVSLNRSHLGCPIVRARHERDASGDEAPTYPACTGDARAAIAAFEPDVAVLMVGGPMVNEYDIGGGHFVGACDADFAKWYTAGVRRSIATMSSTGAPVVVVSVVHPPRFIDVGPGISVPAAYARDVDCLNRWLRAAVAAAPGARFLDLDAYVCPGGECRTKLDGVTLRGDGRHFQGPAANLIAKWMLPRVLESVGTHS